jgi:hypothetical protein
LGPNKIARLEETDPKDAIYAVIRLPELVTELLLALVVSGYAGSKTAWEFQYVCKTWNELFKPNPLVTSTTPSALALVFESVFDPRHAAIQAALAQWTRGTYFPWPLGIQFCRWNLHKFGWKLIYYGAWLVKWAEARYVGPCTGETLVKLKRDLALHACLAADVILEKPGTLETVHSSLSAIVNRIGTPKEHRPPYWLIYLTAFGWNGLYHSLWHISAACTDSDGIAAYLFLLTHCRLNHLREVSMQILPNMLIAHKTGEEMQFEHIANTPLYELEILRQLEGPGRKYK